ncbi:DUF6503 family protein [Winogradskyella sp.]|uniref:DUF6503 family protein n=1 Tax=Winogradskyella sp. TaxID=1883156 RepID=UPI002602856F|nr:DUF6503 family protein [Winogradskyella sp.]
MTKIYVFTLLLFSLVSCNRPMTNEALITKSIEYHDPNQSWPLFKGNFKVDLAGQEVALVIDNAKGIFHWTETLKSGEKLTGGYANKDTCMVKLNGKDILPEGKLDNFLLDCENIIGRTNYWIYMYGLPMKLKDEEVNFIGLPQLVTYLDEDLWMIKVNYNMAQSKEYWQFYFDPKNYSFRIARFFHPALGSDSEYIIYSEPERIKGLLIPTNHSWYMNASKEYIGSEKLEVVSNP